MPSEQLAVTGADASTHSPVREERPFSLRPCDRCGELHLRLMFKPFSRRDIGRWTHWALCPKSGEPVLMAVHQAESQA